jgi:hypothetical protein
LRQQLIDAERKLADMHQPETEQALNDLGAKILSLEAAVADRDKQLYVQEHKLKELCARQRMKHPVEDTSGVQVQQVRAREHGPLNRQTRVNAGARVRAVGSLLRLNDAEAKLIENTLQVRNGHSAHDLNTKQTCLPPIQPIMR